METYIGTDRRIGDHFGRPIYFECKKTSQCTLACDNCNNCFVLQRVFNEQQVHCIFAFPLRSRASNSALQQRNNDCVDGTSYTNHRNGLCWGISRHESMCHQASIAANQSRGRMHSKMHFCVNILNGNLCRAQFKIRRFKIGRNPPPFLGTMR